MLLAETAELGVVVDQLGQPVVHEAVVRVGLLLARVELVEPGIDAFLRQGDQRSGDVEQKTIKFKGLLARAGQHVGSRGGGIRAGILEGEERLEDLDPNQTTVQHINFSKSFAKIAFVFE